MIDYPRLLPRILSDYDLPPVRHEHVRTSENLVVRLVTDDGRAYALRIRRLLGAYLEQIRSELMVLRDFSLATGADVPAPLAARDGELFRVVAEDGVDYLCILFHWVAGRHLAVEEITTGRMAAMARATGRLHAFSAGYTPPRGFARPVYDEEWFFGEKNWGSSEAFVRHMDPDAAAGLGEIDNAVRARLKAFPRTPETFGLIHYDLHAGNFLFHGTEAHLIDFDECGFGYYLFDLAHLLFGFIENPRYDELKRTALERYASTRASPPCSEADLNLFLSLQGIAYLNWLYRLFWRDGRVDALGYWLPTIAHRLRFARL